MEWGNISIIKTTAVTLKNKVEKKGLEAFLICVLNLSIPNNLRFISDFEGKNGHVNESALVSLYFF